ncbi:MAG: hypothetical protein CMP58_04065 [Flavobacteriales bacterium]|nr:hypothetical protein [Flavobacteriales bacterium]|tara:strand:+ start:132 stop:527 length:396 start_codon:yes stop_codon:yes gene_type:complete
MRILLFYLLITPFFSLGQTQLQMNLKSGDKWESIDHQMTTIYKTILDLYSDDESFINALKEDQKNWMNLRKSNNELMYPDKKEDYYYGSYHITCKNDFDAKIIKQRIDFLMQWILGSEEGDVCNGTLKRIE